MIERIRNYSRIFYTSSHRRLRGWPSPADHKRESIEESAVTIRAYLQQNGTRFSLFALYLASRIDVLPAEYCREFELTPDIAPILTASEVEQIMIDELGATFYGLFKKFDFAPFKSGLLGQIHRAELVNSETVEVFVLRPEHSSVTKANQWTERFKQVQIQDFCPDFSNEDLFADFLAALSRATNLRTKGQTAELIFPREESEETGPCRRLYGELSGNRVLTLSYTGEMCLDELLHAGVHDSQALARAVCRRWLSESLNRRFCPIDPRSGNIMTSGPLAIKFNGNEFIELPQRTKDNLRSYLLAALEDDPDRAARFLLQEMIPPKYGVSEVGEFRSRFRQAAYFGALEPILGTNTNALAQLIFQHWKTALAYGYQPTSYLLCFYRGLFSIARVARKIAPAEDPLREGLEELNALMTVDQFKNIATASYWFQTSDKFAMAMINFPRALGEALDQGARPNLDDWSSIREHSSQNRRFPSGVLAAVAIIFIFQGDVNAWMEKGVVLILMITGLVALQLWDN